MENKLYTLYDKIISTTYINIGISGDKNSGIYFNSFNKNFYVDKVFLKVAFMVAAFEHKKIYLNCKLFDFFKILLDNYSIKEILQGKCKLRYCRRPSKNYTDINTLALFEAKEFNVNIEIFEKIWKEYYSE